MVWGRSLGEQLGLIFEVHLHHNLGRSTAVPWKLPNTKNVSYAVKQRDEVSTEPPSGKYYINISVNKSTTCSSVTSYIGR